MVLTLASLTLLQLNSASKLQESKLFTLLGIFKAEVVICGSK